MKIYYGLLSVVLIAVMALAGCVTVVTSDRCRDPKTGRFIVCP